MHTRGALNSLAPLCVVIFAFVEFGGVGLHRGAASVGVAFVAKAEKVRRTEQLVVECAWLTLIIVEVCDFVIFFFIVEE